MSSPPPTSHAYDLEDIALMVGAVVTVVVLLWLLAVGASLLYDGTLPPLVPSVAGMVRIISHHHWHEPAAAFDVALRRHMPEGPIWWLGAATAAATAIGTGIGIWMRIDRRRSLATLGRRAHELRGARPRSWARPRDLSDLTVRKIQPNRFTLGRLDRRLLASHPEAHVAVVAPTRSGKTTRCVIPWLLEHEGPAIITSTKTDVLEATKQLRGESGRVWVWDPFGAESIHWTPLSGCQDWSFALRQAQWLADATREGDSEIASYWRGEAARLLAPLLYAAAVTGKGITQVLSWVDGQNVKRPLSALRETDNDGAIDQLSGIIELDPRNRGTIYMSAGSLLAAYRFPEAAACATEGLTPIQFLDGEANTLYVVASSREQRLLAPLAVAMLSSLIHTAIERADPEQPLDPTLRILLDEAANIAPLRELPVHLSQAAAHGLRFATFWQSVAQLQERYHHGADDILANSTAKLFMGPVTDDSTRRYLLAALGEERAPNPMPGKQSNGSIPRPIQKGTSAELQQLEQGHALLVEGRHAPAVVQLRPWWERRGVLGSLPEQPGPNRQLPLYSELNEWGP